MATLSGKRGKVEYGGDAKTDSIRNWTMDAETNMLDHTVWSTGTDQWRSFTDGLSQWSGEIGDLFDPASTGQRTLIDNFITPTTANITLYLDKTGGENFQGSCYISGLSAGAQIDADSNARWRFQGTGALTYSTAT